MALNAAVISRCCPKTRGEFLGHRLRMCRVINGVATTILTAHTLWLREVDPAAQLFVPRAWHPQKVVARLFCLVENSPYSAADVV